MIFSSLLLLWVSFFVRSVSSSVSSLSSIPPLLPFEKENEREREKKEKEREREREGLGSPKGEWEKEEYKHSGPRLTTRGLPVPSSSNLNEGIEGIESLPERQLYLPLKENLVWPGR